MFVCLFLLVLQELNVKLINATQEKEDLLSKVSILEETESSAKSEGQKLQEKVNALVEERAEGEKEMASLRESLETLEKEKQVCC